MLFRSFLENFGLSDPNYLAIKLIIASLLISFALVILFKRRSFSLPFFLIVAAFSFLAYTAIRNFSLFGLVALPILSYNISESIQGLKKKFDAHYVNLWFLSLGLMACFFVIFHNYSYLTLKTKRIKLGLLPGVNASADFFKQHEIQGPIFNNYDIGGYLIFHLYPKERVFVDNRPESYAYSFFKDIYIPLQEDEKIWEQYSQAYNFNSIFFYRRDITSWAQKFLINRVHDDGWIPVYVDNYAIIFLKNNQRNATLIKQYAIPKNNFRITK